MINIDFQDISIMGVADTGGSGGGTDLSNYYNKTEVDSKLATKVDKVTGKGLSTNDYTSAEKTKLAGLTNYDDTAIKQQITDINTAIGDIGDVLDKINGEVI